jgi:hypothetical protein
MSTSLLCFSGYKVIVVVFVVVVVGDGGAFSML